MVMMTVVMMCFGDSSNDRNDCDDDSVDNDIGDKFTLISGMDKCFHIPLFRHRISYTISGHITAVCLFTLSFITHYLPIH